MNLRTAENQIIIRDIHGFLFEGKEINELGGQAQFYIDQYYNIKNDDQEAINEMEEILEYILNLDPDYREYYNKMEDHIFAQFD